MNEKTRDVKGAARPAAGGGSTVGPGVGGDGFVEEGYRKYNEAVIFRCAGMNKANAIRIGRASTINLPEQASQYVGMTGLLFGVAQLGEPAAGFVCEARARRANDDAAGPSAGSREKERAMDQAMSKGATEMDMDKAADGAGEMAHPLVPAQRVNGADVYNQAKEKIGRIEDIAIDKRSGKVAYAILSFGGFLGMGDKHQPLPWSVLNYDPRLNGYVVDITKEFLALAPKLKVSQLSGWDDSDNRAAFHSYYSAQGARPYW